jgi:V/A-type H+-transporting ATPase subunit E
MESGKADKLRRRIISDAEADARKIIGEGQGQAAAIKDEADKKVREIAADFAAKAESQAKEYIRRQISLRELEERKAVLAEKGDLIDKVFDRALEELRERDRKGAYSLTRRLLLDAIETGDEEVIFSPEDKRGIGGSFIEGLNAELRKAGKRGQVKVSEETRPISGGFVLRRGRAEINAAFDTLLTMLRYDIETEVAGILFGGKGAAK